MEESALKKNLLARENRPDLSFCGLVGQSEVMLTLFAKIARVAPSDHCVLVQGESGTGKELVAQAIHQLSQRKAKPYVVINCAAISENLIESELFGHEKGSFTGAYASHQGAFEQAQEGTLFLDEVGDLPLELQAKLLRVLENKTIRRVGGKEEIIVNVRPIAATHHSLPKQVMAGKFRQDLYYRLHVLPLCVPTLRARKSDIPLLAKYFLEKESPHCQKNFSLDTLQKLMDYFWPGNVRELRNVVLRAALFSRGGSRTAPTILTPSDIEFVIVDEAETETELKKRCAFKESVKVHEFEEIKQALIMTNGNKAAAAALLGLSRSTFYGKIQEHNKNL